jgi:oligoribonuclease NrnB/cAMP/cGMP phosphodiesterase (DHH superfamily)
MNKTTLRDYIGDDLEDDFLSFDLTEIKLVLDRLQNTDAIDLSHAELLQQQALRGADVLTEYLGKIVKTVSYLEGKINTLKNKVSLEYKAPDGSKTTTDMKIWAGSASSEVEDIQIKLARAKGSKSVLEKKYDILIKSHHHYKDIAMGLRKTVLGYNNTTTSQEKMPEGWD